MPRTINFITGPSRTGDIEQRIELGAHGPRRCHIILVDDRQGMRQCRKTGDMASRRRRTTLWREAMRDVKPLRGREPAILSTAPGAGRGEDALVKPHRLPGLDRFPG